MTSSKGGLYPLVVSVLVLILSSEPWAVAKKGRTISVGDDPSAKEGSPELVVIEVSGFQ